MLTRCFGTDEKAARTRTLAANGEPQKNLKNNSVESSLCAEIDFTGVVFHL